MKRKNVFTVILALVTIGFMGCQEEELTGKGPSTLDVKLLALNKSYSLPVNKSVTKSAVAESPSLSWDTVNMVVSEVKLEAEVKSLVTREDSIEIEFKWNGPQMINLLDSTISFGNFLLQPGYYDEIELKVKGEQEDAQSGPVFYMSGTYTNAEGGAVLVVVEVLGDLEFKTEKESVEINESNMEIVSYVQLYLDELFLGITPQQLDDAVLTDGVLVISDDTNSELYQAVWGKLTEDHDSDYWHDDDKYDDDDDDDHDDDDDDDNDDD
jgi:hypothetical protein